MSPVKKSKSSTVKTLKLKHGPAFIEVTAGVLKDKPAAKKRAAKRKK